ncbi:acid protease [Amniculicola lignicola CBS 123094]|uniref:Acid protease n=1 Tax=Amniculicola lignicola CBS 123094 TaxID=1392246 RepID=A0A6A5W5L2_9PLEO|nr:acid protease [Amniculicola lignicola CBS 123094]
MYNPLNSSTSSGSLTGCKVAYFSQMWGLSTWGNETQDSVYVADIELGNQTFESVAYWWPYPGEPDDLYDTVLGLALRDIEEDQTTLHSPSSFQGMLDQGLLHEDLFALRMSRNDEGVGELTLGGIPEYIDRDKLVNIPLTQNYAWGDTEDIRFYSSNGWQVGLQDITISGHSLTRRSFLASNYTALLSTSYPWIIFPWDDAKAIWAVLGFEAGPFPCEARYDFPNITFMFSPSGQEVTLSWWDYVMGIYNDTLGRLECLIMIGGGDEQRLNGYVLLGNPFLNGLYSVWDAGRRTISLANRPL